jgi:hypothetical protein
MRGVYLLVASVALFAPAAFAQPLPCPDLSDPLSSKASKDFVVPYMAASAAFRQGRHSAAILLADAASPFAQDAVQLQAALSLRAAGLFAIGDDEALSTTLLRQIELGCHGEASRSQTLADQLEAARKRLGAQPH